MSSKAYAVRENQTRWSDSDGDLVMATQNLAAAAGRIGAQLDLEDANGKKAGRYHWRATVQMETAGVVGETVDLYGSTSNGTNPDGEEGIADAALSSTDKLKNMLFIDSIVIDTTSTAADITASGHIWLTDRYFSPVIHNNTADGLKNTANVSEFILTPAPDEGQ